MKLSIIIPMYNVELYIEKCLLSCLKQDIPSNDYEIIVVNDGSPDNSLTIAQRIAEKEGNIHIVSQPNGGLSAARNKGLSLAKGEYVWFIDSDDWIEENCLSKLVCLCRDVDVIAISYNIVENNRNKEFKTKHAKLGKELLSKGSFIPAPFYIMRHEFLLTKRLLFFQGIYHEDLEFTPRMLYLADKIVTTEQCVYYYLQRENSITTTPNPKRAFDYIKIAKSLKVFKEQNVENSEQILFENKISLCINNALAIISNNDNEQKSLWHNSLLDNKDILHSLMKSSIWKYKIQGLLFMIMPFLNKIKLYKFMQLLNCRKR